MLALLLSIALSLADEAVAAPALPDDPRLAPVREKLDETVARAASAGLPVDLLVGKVREGLAKGVPPARIEAAVGKLAESLAEAQRLLSARRPGPPAAALIRAVAEARMAGLPSSAIDPLVDGRRPEAAARRSIEVLTDLSLRGYPVDRAALLVRDLLARDAPALDRLSAALETVRQDYALSHVEATDALARGLAASDSLQSALGRTAEDERRKGNDRSRDRSEGRDSPGKSGLAPGHLPRARGPKRR